MFSAYLKTSSFKLFEYLGSNEEQHSSKKPTTEASCLTSVVGWPGEAERLY
jgi:hypothetical protein